jgi:hypothetical protein
MSGFTKEEIAAELARRKQVQREIERSRSDQAERARMANANARCMHCHSPFNSLTGGAHGLCYNCLDAE